jgi:hypothetical protein
MQSWKKYVLWFAQEHVDFRAAVSEHFSVDKIEIEPFVIVGNTINPENMEYSDEN